MTIEIDHTSLSVSDYEAAKRFYAVALKPLRVEIMMEFPGRVLSKGGAQGVLCGAALEEGLGYAIKMVDGFKEHMGLVLARLLAELGIPGVSEAIHGDGRFAAPQTNHKGEQVGGVEAIFHLAASATFSGKSGS